VTNVDGSRVAESTHEIRPWRKGSDTCTFLLAGGARGPGSRRYEETSAVAHAPPRKFVQCNAIQQSQSIYASENLQRDISTDCRRRTGGHHHGVVNSCGDNGIEINSPVRIAAARVPAVS
jgi:hypothetical protein